MVLEDPVVWVLIVVAIVLLFGSSRIPQFARALGSARREFEQAWRGMSQPQSSTSQPVANAAVSPSYPSSQASNPEDPIITAARNEGIPTEGKTRQQIASDLAWKLKQKDSV
jgi:sec-independent protein translocase protein TatA